MKTTSQFKGYIHITKKQHKELLEKMYYTLKDGTIINPIPGYYYASPDDVTVEEVAQQVVELTEEVNNKYEYLYNCIDANSYDIKNIQKIYANTYNNNTFSGNNTFTGENHFKDIVVEGNIIQQGETYETHAEKVFTKDDYIIMRDGAAAGLANDEYTGFQATKYDGENDVRLVFDNTGTARVGDVGNEQPLATRAETNELGHNAVMVWDAINYRMVSGGFLEEFQKTIDYNLATEAKTVSGAINELRTNVIVCSEQLSDVRDNILLIEEGINEIRTDHNNTKTYQYATTISIDKNNVNTYLEFSSMEALSIEVLRGRAGADVRNKIFDITPLLLQISNGEIGSYKKIIVNGVDTCPVKCVINKPATTVFSNAVEITFQNALGYAKIFPVRTTGSMNLAMTLVLNGDQQCFGEFDINGETSGFYC